MAETFVERNLFADPSQWISNKSDSVNKPPSAYFEASSGPSGMLVTNGLIKPWSGAMVSNTIQPPVTTYGRLMHWIIYRLKFRIPGMTAANLARLENDLKVCVKTRPTSTTYIRNVANFSCQWNADSGQWQIDKDPPGWIDTGFITETLEPDLWHTLEFRYSFDDEALTFSMLSIQLDDELYEIPENLRNVMMTSTNWEKCRKLQVQTCGYAAQSTVLTEYKDGELAWSDERIPAIPPASLRAVRQLRPGDERETKFWDPGGQARPDGEQSMHGG